METQIIPKSPEAKKPEAPPTKDDPNFKIKELESKMVQSFMGSPEQKTEISVSERFLLSTLEMIAKDPFPSARKKCKLDNKAKDEVFQIPFLQDWIKDYIKFGIPMGRKGRKEEVQVLQAYFSGNNEAMNNGLTQSKLLK